MTNMSESLPPCWDKFSSFPLLHKGKTHIVLAFEEYKCLCDPIIIDYMGGLVVNPVTRFDDPATRIIAAMNALDTEIAAKAAEVAAKAAEVAAKAAEVAAKAAEAAAKTVEAPAKAAEAAAKTVEAPVNSTVDDLYAD